MAASYPEPTVKWIDETGHVIAGRGRKKKVSYHVQVDEFRTTLTSSLEIDTEYVNERLLQYIICTATNAIGTNNHTFNLSSVMYKGTNTS